MLQRQQILNTAPIWECNKGFKYLMNRIFLKWTERKFKCNNYDSNLITPDSNFKQIPRRLRNISLSRTFDENYFVPFLPVAVCFPSLKCNSFVSDVGNFIPGEERLFEAVFFSTTEPLAYIAEYKSRFIWIWS